VIIAIDFDGVICDRQGIPRGDDWKECKPTKDAQSAIYLLTSQGHTLYIFTNRESDEWGDILEWMLDYDFPELPITNSKLPGTSVYIDDRCIRFTNWLDVCKYFG